jgi:hypothetical protein
MSTFPASGLHLIHSQTMLITLSCLLGSHLINSISVAPSFFRIYLCNLLLPFGLDESAMTAHSGQGARRASSNMDAVQAGGVVINIEKILSSGGNEGSRVEIEAARARFLARKQSKTIKL